jgi:hypothetical protein
MSLKQTNIFDFLVETLSSNIDNILDVRRQRSDLQYKFRDILLSAFAVFYFQSSNWLGFQRNMQSSKGSSNCSTMFNIETIPSDNHIRQILDKIEPNNIKPVYDSIIKKLDDIKVLDKFEFMDNSLLVALDGTYYHSSKNISCKCCQKREDKESREIHYYHSAITPTIVHPDIKRVLPLMQEFIANDDGDDKQDCEVNASKRWLDNFTNPTNKKLIILGDDLYSREPMIQKVLDKEYSYIFVAKKESHKYLYEQIDMVKNLGTCDIKRVEKVVNGKKQITIYSYINDLMIKNSQGSNKQPLTTNWCEMVVTDLKGKKLYSNSFITDITIHQNNVEQISQAGRTRWKIENENNNVLKTKGYNLEHNFGHGKEYLSQTLCSLNILAFLFHTVQDLTDELYQNLREEMGTREEFFTAISFLSTMFTFKSFDKMLEYILISRRSDENISLEGYV